MLIVRTKEFPIRILNPIQIYILSLYFCQETTHFEPNHFLILNLKLSPFQKMNLRYCCQRIQDILIIMLVLARSLDFVFI
jgi:hypothetical protein